MKLLSKIIFLGMLGLAGGMMAQVLTSMFPVGVGNGQVIAPALAQSGGSVLYGTFAALPSPSSTYNGSEYVTTNSPYFFVGASAAWQGFLPGAGAVSPTVPSFAWANQGGASVSTTEGGEAITAPANSGTNVRVRFVADPATPYSVTAGFTLGINNQNYYNAGLCLYNSSSGKVMIFGPNSQFPFGVQINRFNTVTSFNSATTNMWLAPSGTVLWLKIRDDGTNYTFSYSTDAVNYVSYLVESRTTFLTPQSVGYCLDVENGTYPAYLWLLDWTQGS